MDILELLGRVLRGEHDSEYNPERYVKRNRHRQQGNKMRSSLPISIFGLIIVAGCNPAVNAPAETVFCVQAPQGYVMPQEKWDPYSVPCPPKLAALAAPAAVASGTIDGVAGAVSPGGGAPGGTPGGGAPGGAGGAVSVSASSGPGGSSTSVSTNGAAASATAGPEGAYTSVSSSDHPSAAAAGAGDGEAETSVSSGSVAASASASKGNVSTSVSSVD